MWKSISCTNMCQSIWVIWSCPLLYFIDVTVCPLSILNFSLNVDDDVLSSPYIIWLYMGECVRRLGKIAISCQGVNNRQNDGTEYQTVSLAAHSLFSFPLHSTKYKYMSLSLMCSTSTLDVADLIKIVTAMTLTTFIFSHWIRPFYKYQQHQWNIGFCLMRKLSMVFSPFPNHRTVGDDMA